MKPTSLRQRKHDERTAALLWAFIIQRGLLDQFKRFYIERDGEKYSEAIDPADIPREYTETDEPIDSGEEPTVDDALGMLAEMGVDVHD